MTPGAAAERLKISIADVNRNEKELEAEVSRVVRDFPFLWLDVPDDPGPQSDRAVIESNTIALLSNFGKSPQLDGPSQNWLGHYCDREDVRLSGLWNVQHVRGSYRPEYLAVLESYIERIVTEGVTRKDFGRSEPCMFVISEDSVWQVEIPAELYGQNINLYDVDVTTGSWYRKGSAKVVARSRVSPAKPSGT